MSKYWSAGIADLTPYVPGEQPRIENLTKLNTNENPYGPSPRALEAIHTAASDQLRRYPDPTASALRAVAASQHGLSPEHVFVGNGSDEVLAHAFYALLRHPRPVLFPDVSYSFYPVYCQLYGIGYLRVPVNDAFEIVLSDYRRENGGIIFPNPNAPTGIGLPLADIENLLEHNPDSVVIVDEAYVDFGAQSAVQLVKRFPQLLVVQTLSKSRALAGLRLGFAFGQPALIDALTRVKDSFNSYPVDRLAQAGATAALEDVAYFEQIRERVIHSRDALSRELQALGFEVLPSQANFLFARHPKHEGARLAGALRERAVLVRHFALPRIQDFLRITVGLPAENEKLVAALRDILGVTGGDEPPAPAGSIG